MPPEMLIVAGANGSGKSTFAYEYAERHNWDYLAADAIAAEITGAVPSAEVQIEAGRKFFQVFDRLLERQTSFIIETTLSGLGFRRMIREAQAVGFRVSVYYFYVESADICIARVAERVRKGGHHVPEADVRRRFQRSFSNFWSIYRLMTDNWVVLYNQSRVAQEIAFGEREVFVVGDSTRFSNFLRLAEGESS